MGLCLQLLPADLECLVQVTSVPRFNIGIEKWCVSFEVGNVLVIELKLLLCWKLKVLLVDFEDIVYAFRWYSVILDCQQM